MDRPDFKQEDIYFPRPNSNELELYVDSLVREPLPKDDELDALDCTHEGEDPIYNLDSIVDFEFSAGQKSKYEPIQVRDIDLYE